MASRTLGPFPKSIHWPELVGDISRADRLIDVLLEEYEDLIGNDAAIRAVTFPVALVVCTRDRDVSESMRRNYGIELKDADLKPAIEKFIPEDRPAKRALFETLKRVEEQPGQMLFENDPWRKWREYDGRAFCDLARLFFCNLNEQYFGALVEHGEIPRFAWEMSFITRTFSARWFNACARNQIPEEGSIAWYFGHCIGKLQLELEREKSDWVEPEGNPWRRRRKNPNARLL